MKSPEHSKQEGSGMTLEQYRDEQLAALKQRLNQGLEALRVKLREDVRATFEQNAETLRRDMETRSEKAMQSFNARMTEVEKMRASSTDEVLLQAYEKSLKSTLQITLDSQQKIFDAFVASCQKYLR